MLQNGLSKAGIAAWVGLFLILDVIAQGESEKPHAATKPAMVSNVFLDTDLRQALQDIATQVGVIIVLDESVTGLITCELKEMPLEKALEIVLAGTGFVVKKTPDYYLVCSADPASPSFALISETKVFRVNYLKATTAAKLLSSAFQDYVRADDDTETVCITAPPALMEQIMKDLKLLDQPLRQPRHVMLQARIVVLERADLLNMGIQWNWPQVQMGTFSNSNMHGGAAAGVSWPWGIQIGYTTGQEFTNALVLTLDLLTQNNEATLVACPQLMAQDGKEAEIKVNTEEYFDITSEGIYVTSKLEKVETGTILKIVPQIGAKGDITLTMAIEVSGVVARGENNLPVVTRRIAKSTVRIEDGGTAVVAGLMDNRSEATETWVPGIGDVPLLGHLFRHDLNRNTSRQIAVFVTASLVRERRDPVEKTRPERRPIKLVSKEEFQKALVASLERIEKGKQ